MKSDDINSSILRKSQLDRAVRRRSEWLREHHVEHRTVFAEFFSDDICITFVSDDIATSIRMKIYTFLSCNYNDWSIATISAFVYTPLIP
jgi:hypothetical protein